MFGKKWRDAWKLFDKAMDSMDDSLAETMEKAFGRYDENQTGNVVNGDQAGGDIYKSVYKYNGQRIVQKNGHIAIDGKIDSLTINGVKMVLVDNPVELEQYHDELEGLMRNVIARRASVPADLFDMAKQLNKGPVK